MGAVSRPRKAGGRRLKRQGQFPARFSREYPVHEGHDYSLNGIPSDVWERAKKRAHAQERAVRVILIRALDLYGSGRIDL